MQALEQQKADRKEQEDYESKRDQAFGMFFPYLLYAHLWWYILWYMDLSVHPYIILLTFLSSWGIA